MRALNKIFWVGLLTGLVFCFGIIYFFLFVHLSDTLEITSEHRHELLLLGSEAAIHHEVPVASIMVYGKTVIGRGRNTVMSDTNIAAHAEVNAINDAMRSLGAEKFRFLNRDSLVLVTTFEPCPMCAGALAESNIHHLVVIQRKSIYYKWKEWKKILTLEKNEKFVEDDALQDSLFRQFPGVNLDQIQY